MGFANNTPLPHRLSWHHRVYYRAYRLIILSKQSEETDCDIHHDTIYQSQNITEEGVKRRVESRLRSYMEINSSGCVWLH